MFKVTQNHKLPVITPESKYIIVKYYWFRDNISSGGCSIKKVDGKYQKSDILTKGLHGVYSLI